MHASNTSLNLSKTDPSTTLKSSRLSLPDHFAKARGGTVSRAAATAIKGNATPTVLLKQHHARTLSDSNYSCQTDNSSSRTSSDLELYRKRGQQRPSPARCPSNNSLPLRYVGDSSENESSVEFRQRSDSELDRQRSRRPLSQESISEIESLSEQFEETLSSHELDTYLSHLQGRDLLPYQHTSTSHATPTSHLLNDANAAAGADILTNLIKPPKTFRNPDDGDGEQHFYGNIHFLSSTDSIQQLGEGGAAVAAAAAAAAYLTPMHSRNNSNISTQSAPYYYSELPAPLPLNNQRDIHAHGLNIAHIHNPIDRHQFNMDALVDKDQAIDSKNLYCVKANNEKLSYSSNKNLNLKAGQAQLKLNNMQLVGGEAVEGPAGESGVSGSSSSPSSSGTQSHPLNPAHSFLTTTKNTNLARKSIGGSLLDEGPHSDSGNDGVNVHGVGVDKCRPSAESAGPEGGPLLTAGRVTCNNGNQLSVLGGELLWEEDTLWRESLRRVSQRHARSLDDLDRIAAGPICSTPKTKLSREVTYVNDSQKPPQRHQQSASDEHDVYVQLMGNSSQTTHSQDQTDSDVYEVLREDTASNLSHKSNELDRETIRQWDAMSSGLMKTTSHNVETAAPMATSARTPTSTRSASSSGPKVSLPLTSSVRSIIQQLNGSGQSNTDDDNGNPIEGFSPAPKVQKSRNNN
ncbi:GL23086 [Drosophila persimilis]|uniref:GL23086 n=1 Tax=Drosophila persimilis TaxID=7234 RepID=B4G3I3_DROPE|nr:GL23086 [Drosophila persimilis]